MKPDFRDEVILFKTQLKKESNELLQTHQGKILKYSPALFSSWQERFFVLHNKKLRWYVKEKDTIPQGVLNFDFFKCELRNEPKDKRCFNLTLLGSERVF